jgi:DNA invertase Pin-like site-specific DNA recombinase
LNDSFSPREAQRRRPGKANAAADHQREESTSMASRQIRLSPNTAQPGAPRVYGYCRVSTNGQAESGLGLEEQERRITGRALENGWQLEHIFVDAGVSGSIALAARPEGARLLQALQPGDQVIAAKLDRVFRSALDALETIEAFKRQKISLWLLDLGGDCSGNGISELVLTIMSAVAQFERARIGERIADAKAAMRYNGLHQGGNRPFGWKFGEGVGRGRTHKLVEDEAEQGAIATMKTMRAAGASLMEIRDTLRARGFRISHESVRQILARDAA